MRLKSVALLSCLGGAGALGLRAQSRETGSSGRDTQQLPLWTGLTARGERPLAAKAGAAELRRTALSVAGEGRPVARKVSEAAVHAALASKGERRQTSNTSGKEGERRPRADGRLCNAFVVLPCRAWLSDYPCSTTWGEACPGVDSAFGPEYNDARLGASCPGECPQTAAAVASTARASKEQAAAEAAASRGFRTWSPCDLGVELPCSFWTQSFACSTKWREACPGVDNPAGQQFNDVAVGAACPDQCGGSGVPLDGAFAPLAPTPAPERLHAEDHEMTRVFPALCSTEKVASCKMWASAYPSCDVTWSVACPGVDNPNGAAYNAVSVAESCPRECDEARKKGPCHSSDLGHLDRGNYNCKLGYAMPNYCGFYDDEDFTAGGMCCECGGGGPLQEAPRGATPADTPQLGDGPPVAAGSLAWPIAAGSQVLKVYNAGIFSDGDLLEISRGRNRETIVAYFSDNVTLHVKAGLKYSYLLGALITRKAEAKYLWCRKESSYDCKTWSKHFHCSFSYSSICPGMDSPYDPSLKHVSLQVMCPMDCGALHESAPPPETPDVTSIPSELPGAAAFPRPGA